MDCTGSKIPVVLLTLVGLTTLQCVRTQDCAPERFMPLPPTSECYRPFDDAADCTYAHYSCTSSPDSITWSVLSTTTGRLDVTFVQPFSSCNHTQYDVELRVSETADVREEADCAKARFDEFHTTHTKRKFIVEDECANVSNCSPTCNERAVVSFQYVFTGCYQLVIQPRSGSHTKRRIQSCPKYVRTDYTKHLLSEENTTFATQYRDHMRNSHVVISYAPLTCNHLYMVIKLIANVSHHEMGEACSKTGRLHSSCRLGPNQTSNCENSSMDIVSSIPDCTTVSDQVVCTFDNMSPGNYCIRMEVHDDRCDLGTLWTKHGDLSRPNVCVWQNVFEAMAGPISNATKTEPVPGGSRTYLIIAGVLFTATVVCVGIVCFSLRALGRRRSRTAHSNALECPVAVEPCRILLLYARDCLPFMQLMATFRQVLEDRAFSEVYDCFDASRWPELSRNPVDWMRRLVQQPDMRIVLVATKCSSLRQQALRENRLVRYTEPTANDDLFLYALQALTEQLAPDLYKRIFIVRFEGIANDADLYTNLSSYTRFVLPLHLDKLIYNLNESVFSDQSIRLEEMEVQGICQDLTNLISYMQQNANYFQHILSIQRTSS